MTGRVDARDLVATFEGDRGSSTSPSSLGLWGGELGLIRGQDSTLPTNGTERLTGVGARRSGKGPISGYE